MENTHWAMWYVYGLHDLMRFQFQIGQHHILDFFNCFVCSGFKGFSENSVKYLGIRILRNGECFPVLIWSFFEIKICELLFMVGASLRSECLDRGNELEYFEMRLHPWDTMENDKWGASNVDRQRARTK